MKILQLKRINKIAVPRPWKSYENTVNGHIPSDRLKKHEIGLNFNKSCADNNISLNNKYLLAFLCISSFDDQ